MITIILAGGKSSRMGENKALLKIGGVRLIDKLVMEFLPFSDKILLVVDDPSHYHGLPVELIIDDVNYKGQGPLAGMWTAFQKVEGKACLVVACDMPFATRELGLRMIHQLIENKKEAVVPYINNQVHPLFAAYDGNIVSNIKMLLDEGKRSVQSLIERLNVQYVSVEDYRKAVWNMNTKEEYMKVIKMSEGGNVREL